MVRPGLDICGLEYGPEAGFCQLGNEPTSSIKCEKFLD